MTMNGFDLYHHLLKQASDEGDYKLDRTGIGTKSLYGVSIKYNLLDNFPAITTKRLMWNSVVAELLWMLEGSTDERRLAEIQYGKPRSELIGKQTIWTANANSQGKDLGFINNDIVKELGPIYGKQWRNFEGVDQIQELITNIKRNPNSRRHIVSAWNPRRLPEMALPPCHMMYQLIIDSNNRIHTILTQRSGDAFLGIPWNVAFYSLLTYLIGLETGYIPGSLTHNIADFHVYMTHIEAVNELYSRYLNNKLYYPKLIINNYQSIFTLKTSDILLDNYKHMGDLKAPMAI